MKPVSSRKISVATAVGVALLSAVASASADSRVVGIGIAKSSSHVYAWFDDGTVSSGTSGNFALYIHPNGFSLPGNEQPKDILAVSIAKNDHVYVWYRDGMVSQGTSRNLGQYKGLAPVQPAAGKSVADIRAIGIAGSNDKTYAWYADGTVSVGSSGRLDAYEPASAVTFPPGKTMADVVEIDIAPDDRVYSWFSDGTLYVGTSHVLARYDGPRGYRSRMVIQAELKPGRHITSVPHPHQFLGGEADESMGSHPIHGLPSGTIGSSNPPGDITPREVGMPSTATLTPLAPNPTMGGPDPMVAVGPRFMIISDTGNLVFADRNAVQLKKIPNGLDTSLTSGDFFHQFIDDVDASGAPNPLSINRHTGFPSDCKPPNFPQTTRNGFCLDDVYDTRVFFDGDSQRFFVVAHVRNQLWISFKPEYLAAHGGSCGFFEAPLSTTTFEGRKCLPPDTNASKVQCPMVNPKQCALGRRHYLMAVSKTDDPRDGFFQFAVTENVMADFPWMAINRNRVVLTHEKAPAQPPDWPSKQPVVMVFDKSALLAGSTQPPFFTYGPDDLSGEGSVDLVTQPGGAGTTLMTHVGSSKVRIFGFLNNTPDPWKAPELIKAAIGVDGAPGGLGAVHRNGLLYLVGTKGVESTSAGTRRSVHLVRIPLNRTGNDILVSKDKSAGYLDYFFGLNSPTDPPQSRFSYEKPAIAVNKKGDMLFGYHRLAFANSSATPDARVSFWPAKADAPFASQLLMDGTGGTGGQSDYSTAVIDPDDQTFWVAQPFGVSGGFNTAVGHLVP